MGKSAAEFPDELTFNLLRAGFTTNCYDGQLFFDTDHPVINPALNATMSASNMQAGTGPAWFLLDVSRPMKPMFYQERLAYTLTELTKSGDQNVFFRDEYIYGTRGRSNVGFGLWQLAFGSKADLNSANYSAARSAMMNLRGEGGRILGIKPTFSLSPQLWKKRGRMLINSDVLPS